MTETRRKYLLLLITAKQQGYVSLTAYVTNNALHCIKTKT